MTASDVLPTILEGMALYRPPWKLVAADSPRLYQTYLDPSEEHGRAADQPEIVDALTASAAAWPCGPKLDRSILAIVLDPDSFGGPEADAARQCVQSVQQRLRGLRVRRLLHVTQ